MSESSSPGLYDEVDKLLAELKIGDAAQRLASAPVDAGTMLLSKGMLGEAVDSYRTQSELPEGGQFRSFAALYGHLLSEIEACDGRASSSEGTGDAKILISIPVWGVEYIRAMVAVLFPTLLARGNIPTLAKNFEILLEISTRESETELIREMGAVKALGELKNVHVEIVSFPEDIFIEAHNIHGFSYRIMGAMHHLAIHRARAVGGAHIIFLGSDFILSDRLLTNSVACAESGFDLVLTAPMKVSKKTIVPKLLDEANDQPSALALTIPPRHLVDLGLDAIHPESRQLIVSVNTRPFSRAPFPLYFPKDHGYSVRSFMFHPLVMSASLSRKEVMYDYNTVDGVLLDRALLGRRPDDVIKVMADSDDGVFFDVAAERTVKESETVDKFSIAHIIRWLFDWRKLGVEEVYRWLLEQPVRYRSENFKVSRIEGDLDEDLVIGVLTHALERLK